MSLHRSSPNLHLFEFVNEISRVPNMVFALAYERAALLGYLFREVVDGRCDSPDSLSRLIVLRTIEDVGSLSTFPVPRIIQ